MADTNVNLAECLKTVTDLGTNHVHNVCNGSVTSLAWGTVDWLAFIAAAAFTITIVSCFAGMTFMIVRDR